MSISVNWDTRTVITTASITDILVFKNTIRDIEDSDEGREFPYIIDFVKVALGGGAYFYAIDFVNGYKLKFASAGSYEIIGNINCTIDPTPNVYVERKTSAAFSTTSVGGTGGGGLTEEQATQLSNTVKKGDTLLNLGNIILPL